MGVLDRYQNRFKQTYKPRTDGKGGAYLRRAQTSYLHFHAGNIDATPPTVIQNAKDQILKDFAYGMKKNSKQLTSGPLASMSPEDIQKWLHEWTSGDTGGILGQEMGEAIAQKLQDDPYTGAGIMAGFNAAMSGAGFGTKNGLSQSGESLTAQADYLMNEIWEYLNRYVQVFDDAGEEALVLKCLEIGSKGGNFSSDILSKYNGRKITEVELNSLSKKANSMFSKLDDIVNTLQQISSMGHGGASGAAIKRSFGDGTKWNPKTLAKQLGSIFNAIGGEQVGEIVGMTAAQEVLQKGDKEVVQVATKAFEASGAVVFSTSKTGEDTVNLGEGSSIQQKGDWSIIARQGNVTVVIPVSSKLYQGGRSNGKNYTPIGEPFTGIIAAQSIGLDQLLAITLNGSVDWLEQHMAALTSETTSSRADLGNSGDGAAYALWQEFKEAAKWTGLFRALVGTGAKTKLGIDFAALLIINSQVYSMADIIQQFINNPGLFSSSKGNGPDMIPNWPEVRQQVSGSFWGQWMHTIPIQQRLSTQYAAIRTLYGKKYTFEINIGMMAGL